jgi:hypothetical protein
VGASTGKMFRPRYPLRNVALLPGHLKQSRRVIESLTEVVRSPVGLGKFLVESRRDLNDYEVSGIQATPSTLSLTANCLLYFFADYAGFGVQKLEIARRNRRKGLGKLMLDHNLTI